jgi:hypothetical protein
MIKLNQKRNCNSCKASEGFTCRLGKSVSESRRVYGIIIEYKPNEPCLKPLTNNDFIAAINLRIGDPL